MTLSLRGNVPEGFWETYTRRPSGLLFQQLILRASGAERTYPGLEQVNACVEKVLRDQGLLPQGDYTPAQVPNLESGVWAKLPEGILGPAKAALMDYYRNPVVTACRKQPSGLTGYIESADGLLKQQYSHRQKEWEQISFWTIHTFSVPTAMARGFLASTNVGQKQKYAQEFRDWFVAYAAYPYYTIPIPAGNGLAGPPYVWGDQWHMERTCSAISSYFTFMTPQLEPLLSAPVPEFANERFDFLALKFLLDQLVKADGLAGGYRLGNHGWFQVRSAVTAALLLPEFKVSDRTLVNALRRAVEHCNDDNRLDGWHRESTLSYMGTYLEMENSVLSVLKEQKQAVEAWKQRTGINVDPYIKTLRDTMSRQQAAQLKTILPDTSGLCFGDGGGGLNPSVALPQKLSDCLLDEGVYVMRSGWEKSAEGKEQVGLGFNAMPELSAHNCSDLLSIMLYAYGSHLLTKPPTYRYENSEHWYKRCTQSTNTAMPGDFADDSQAPSKFGRKEMYGAEGENTADMWPANTWKTRFDQSGSGPTVGWRGAADNGTVLTSWATGPVADYVDAYHDRFVRTASAPWPTDPKPFGPRVRRSVFFVRSSAGGIGPYAFLSDIFTNPTGQPLAGAYRDLNSLFHMPVPDTWPQTQTPWLVEDKTKTLRTAYDTANLTIAPADPENLVVHEVKGLWTRPLKGGEEQETGFAGRYSYTAPYVAYSLPGSPTPVPAIFQAALYPDRTGQQTALQVTRLAVTPTTATADASVIRVAFPDHDVVDLFLQARHGGSLRRFGEGACDGKAAWLRLLHGQVVAATMIDGRTLRWNGFLLHGQPLRGKVTQSEAALQQGFIVHRLRLTGGPIPPEAAGRAMTLIGSGGRVLTTYSILRVVSPNEVVLSETRRTGRLTCVGTDEAHGVLHFDRDVSGLHRGQSLQVFHNGYAHLYRLQSVNGHNAIVTSAEGNKPDIRSLEGTPVPGFTNVYEIVPSGCGYEISAVSSWQKP